MENLPDYLKVNRECWNLRTEQHLKSEFYNLEAFIIGASSLNEIELDLLEDIKGKKVLHLQCHFGQDSLSLARMGAEVTGVDFSDKAIEKARELATQLNLNVKFICCDIYDLPQHLDEKFDIVFTTYGTVGWLPDMNKWAEIVSRYLRVGGSLVFADFHPFVWMYDNDFTKIQYSYFDVETIEETENGTYADKDAPIVTKSIGWNHPVSDILNNLIRKDMVIRIFNEYDYSPYNCFSGMEESGKGQYIIKKFGNKLPLVYAIKAMKI